MRLRSPQPPPELRQRDSPPELREAFAEYLQEVRGLDPLRYDEVEAWAWARLQARLRIAKRGAGKVAA